MVKNVRKPAAKNQVREALRGVDDETVDKKVDEY